MQFTNPFRAGLMSRLLAAGLAVAAGTTASALPPDVISGKTHDPQSGRHAYRGNPGTKAFQRAALKRRNRARHRKACRG